MLGFFDTWMSQPILSQVWANAQSAVLSRLSELGVNIDPETGALTLSEEVTRAVTPPEPNGHDRVTFSGDLSAFRDPPAPSVAAPSVVAPPRPTMPDDDLDRPITRRELTDLVRQLRGGQSPPQYAPAPQPTVQNFRSEAVLNVLEAQIRDAWRRRGRA